MGVIERERTAHAPGADTALRDWVRALEATAPIAAHPQRLLSGVIGEFARTNPDAPALLSRGEIFSYGALAERIDRYARWALDAGIAKGDTVALLMPNRPEYLAIWLGLTSVGVVVALINTGLRGASLAHCLDVATPKHVIVDGELCPAFREVEAKLASRPKVWSHGAAPDGAYRSHRPRGRGASGLPRPRPEQPPVTIEDVALLIYTSGTTGLPKAAQCEPPAPAPVELLVCRPDEYRSAGPDVRLPAALSQRRRRGRDRGAAGARRLGADPRQILGAAFLGRRRPTAAARCSSISANWHVIWSMHRTIRASANTGCACAAATVCAPTSGKNFSRNLRFRAFWNSTPQPKAIFRSTTSKAGSAPSAGFRHSSRTAFRCAVVKFDAVTGEPARDPEGLLHAMRARRTRRSDRPDRQRIVAAGGGFEGYSEPEGIREERSCATYSSAATRGTAPAI